MTAEHDGISVTIPLAGAKLGRSAAAMPSRLNDRRA